MVDRNSLDEMEEPLLVEQSYTFDDKEGLRNTDLTRSQIA